MSFDKNIDGNLDHLDVVGETALVRGTLQSARVGDNGILYVQGTGLQGTFEVESGGTLRIDAGLMGGRVIIHEGGQAVLQGPLAGEVQNAGGLIVNPEGPFNELQVSGPGRTVQWEQVSEATRRSLEADGPTWTITHS